MSGKSKVVKREVIEAPKVEAAKAQPKPRAPRTPKAK
jgi:hypothetical protein